MFYVSSKRNDEYGVTDTLDNIEVFCKEAELRRLSKEYRIYGVSVGVIDIVEKGISPNNELSEIVPELKEAVRKWKEIHNPWTEKEVEKVLDKLPACRIIIDYVTHTEETHTPIKGRTVITKNQYNLYHFFDPDNTFNDACGGVKWGIFGLQSMLWGRGNLKVEKIL